MTSVELEDGEWQQVIQCLSNAPWNIANPLLMRITSQLRARGPIVQKPNSGESYDHVAEKH